MKELNSNEIIEISDHLDIGFKCFINKKDNKLMFIPNELNFTEDEMESWKLEITELKENLIDYYEIKPLNSSDHFLIMKQFTDTLDNTNKLKEELLLALEKKKPFKHFKSIIENSEDYRKNWFDFKNKKIQEWVKKELNEIE